MYIGLGTLLVIVIIAVVLFGRRSRV